VRTDAEFGVDRLQRLVEAAAFRRGRAAREFGRHESASSSRTSVPTAMPGAAHTPASVFGEGRTGARAARRGSRRSAGGAGEPRRLFHFAGASQQLARDRVDGLLRMRAAADQLDRRAFAGAERAGRRRSRSTRGGRRTARRPSRRNRAPLARPRGRARMQAARLREHDLAAHFVAAVGSLA
jgi:hypothetical protein